MKKTLLSLALSLTLVLSSIGLTSAMTDNTIYVDDDNISGPWDGSCNHPFLHIQDGLDVSNMGDTVFIFKGLYVETIVINERISLIGEDIQDTIIYSTGENRYCDVVTILCDFVTCSNFTISLSGVIPELDDPFDDFVECGLHILSDNNVISNILIESRDYNDKSPYFSGISLINCHNSTISNSVIGVNGCGMCLFNSDNNTFFRNFFLMDSMHYLEDADNNLFFQNNFCMNTGIFRYVPFKVLNSYSNIWDKNFWNRYRVLPMPIFLNYISIQTGEWSVKLTFDWEPCKRTIWH